MEATSFLKAHVPDICKEEEFLEIVLLGSLIELGPALNPRNYDKTSPPEINQEEKAAQLQVKRFQSWFALKFVTLIEGKWISPLYIFRRSLLEIASTIFGYLRDHPKLNGTTKKVTHTAFAKMVVRYLKRVDHELLPKLIQLFQQPKSSLRWSGPCIEIFPRPSAPPMPVSQPLIELPSQPIFLLPHIESAEAHSDEISGSSDDVSEEVEDLEESAREASNSELSVQGFIFIISVTSMVLKKRIRRPE